VSLANGPVCIDNIVWIDRGLGSIMLQCLDRQFMVNLIADVVFGYAFDEVSNDVRKMLAGLNMLLIMSFKF